MRKRLYGLAIGTLFGISAIGMSMTAAATEDAAPEVFLDLTEGEIGMAEAVTVAVGNAGLAAETVEFSEKTSEFSDGKYLYNIQFISRGNVKYDYDIDGLTGKILEHEQEPWEADDDREYQGLQESGQEYFISASEDVLAAISKAYDAAVSDAGVSESEFILYKHGVNYEDGKVVLEVNFLMPGTMKYEYDITLPEGKIVKGEQNPWEADDDLEYKDLIDAGTPALAGSTAANGAISAEEAEKIALANAGFSANDVRINKTEKDLDNGVEIYEVDFIGPDGMEYSYDIIVSDGTIMDKDAEFDD